MRQTIKQAIAGSTADYTEIRIERRWLNRVLFQREKLETLESATELGGVVRCLKNGGWGISVFNDTSKIAEHIREATQMAAVVGETASQPVILADVPTVQDEVRVELEHDFRNVPLREKVDLTLSYNTLIMKESDKIVSTQVQYVDRFSEITYANSEGTYLVQELPDITMMLGAAASDGKGDIQQGMEYVGKAGGFEWVQGMEDQARMAAQRAVAMLNAKPVPGGQHTVLLDPRLAGVFIHEAFGHFCEADFLFKNPRLAEIMALGNEFGPPELQVIDAGFFAGERGNVPYDDEGVKRAKTTLVKNGHLHSLLHSRETAAKMGAQPTGNARAVSYEHEPIVRMRNTYIENGPISFDDMIKDVERGIYALDAYGGQTEFEQFSFSAAYAYEIVNGEIGDLVRNVVLSGNLFETMRSIDAIGNDRVISGGVGGCGKGGQFPLPVTVGAPHIRIRNVTIGGK
ncbi:TldD/PmbA family protein [Candidatus Bipolaricaulota bacterium]|nr:TldD/PmbA family protein [Candidatus Bipolaricaulota bacterium]